MPTFEKILQSATESLYGDECLRSNLTDDEANSVLDWATQWIAEQVSGAKDEATAKRIAQNELARVCTIVTAINGIAKKPGVPSLGDAVRALELKTQPPLTRIQTFRLLTVLSSAAWKLTKK
ncbi:MAG: hypothetical protein HY868_11895 [Chloroflexi bacterium]|nr:hypothetical protein [Chloroflexota bacterium]